ncbi:DUF3616 domain-containing protein [Stigmatella erecta]|uniref:DUF3616 domain-containing protein n=1 Tax=Stigmatella erecta TaxID=83460 RepID=A0A1I0LCA5_9BACT|nr:DUF3616 domain-containing protein [Stigmatella erecta]SEU37185.1 Protein of unknown function [Stigmatella erecta]
MRGWKVPVIGALVVCGLTAAGCGMEAPAEAGRERFLEEAQAATGVQSTVFQDGVSPSPGYAGTRDAMIEEERPGANHGGDTSLSASGDTPSGSGNENYILLQWDVSSIPAQAIVRSASISVTVSDKADQSYGFYELTRAWNEGQVTWEKADSSHAWASKGADGSGDRNTLSLGAVKASSTGTFTVALNASGLAVVQTWVAAPSLNRGLIIANKDNDNRLEIRSSEYSTPSARPKLTVVWELPNGEEPGGGTPQPGTYAGTCDGSGGAWIDSNHFLNFNDESQTARIFRQGSQASAVQSQELSSALGLSSSDEADFEDAARVGNRIYVTTSHARNKNGELEASRYKFFALEVSGTVPQASLRTVGMSSNLLKDMLNPANWLQPDASVIALLEARSQLSKATVANLAPKEDGVNIEGLAALPSGAMLVGFRNPQSGANAIIVSLTNPAAVISGARALLGQAFLVNLGGQGVRGMAWSEAHQAVLILSGPRDESNGPFALWKWGGDASSVPQKVVTLTAPSGSAPEAILPPPGTNEVRILFDMGSHLIDGAVCKDAPASRQFFSDVVVPVSG